MGASLLRALPRVDAVVAHDALAGGRRALGMAAVAELCRQHIAAARRDVLGGGAAPTVQEVAQRVAGAVETLLLGRARPVINATGVILHTNLGRAPLSAAALTALVESSAGYASVELDLATGRRGPRGAFLHGALAGLCGAEDALVVNNNAAAVLLVLTALARGRAVVVSRGELVEIGGGFRIPEVLERSGARLVEVGTTNRTRLGDYERALDEHGDVAAFLQIHQSNFRQVGFVSRPELGALGKLARARGVLLLCDLGGGALVDLEPYGLPGEPTAQACVAAGCDLVCFSGDKLLGGPQAGAIVGRRELVAKVRADPLARAVRLGRLPMVALEATVQSYLRGALEELPALAMVTAPVEGVVARVEGWVGSLSRRGVEARVARCEAAVGGGTLAARALPSAAAVIETPRATRVAARLREGEPSVLVRVAEGCVLLDGRTVRPGQDAVLLDVVVAACHAERATS